MTVQHPVQSVGKDSYSWSPELSWLYNTQYNQELVKTATLDHLSCPDCTTPSTIRSWWRQLHLITWAVLTVQHPVQSGAGEDSYTWSPELSWLYNTKYNQELVKTATVDHLSCPDCTTPSTIRSWWRQLHLITWAVLTVQHPVQSGAEDSYSWSPELSWLYNTQSNQGLGKTSTVDHLSCPDRTTPSTTRGWWR